MTSWVPFDVLDHLWQSTLFAAAVWLVARAVRTNAARVRYWLWFAASLKFLIPVSALVTIGERFAWRTTPAAPPPVVSFVIEQVLTPAAVTAATAPAAPATSLALAWSLLIGAWGLGVAVVLAQWWRQWQPIRRALRDARAIDIGQHTGLTVFTSASMVEPGVFGIWRPVLLVPDGIRDRLTPAQLRALIAHERCHVEHHDNLTATLHMAIEAMFWFHPLVWWLERRLIDERERACDEYVLQSGSTPRDYAEGILEVCRYAKDPSPVFVAGVSGSDLRRRIESILRNQTARPLGLERAVALLVCAAAAVLGPVTAGAVQSTKPAQTASDNRPRFEVASIKRTPEATGPGADFAEMPGGRLHARNNPVANFIVNAYGVPRNRLANMPDWLTSERYDLEAKATDGNATRPQLMLMLQTLLEDRFKLRSHRETREGPLYVLSVARGGHKLRASKDGACVEDDPARPQPAPPPGAARRPGCGSNLLNRKGPNIAWFAVRVDMDSVASALAVFTRRTVLNKTGLTGLFDIELELPPLEPAAGADPGGGPDAFTILREQLGLVLEPGTGPMEYFVIDGVERPTGN